MDYRREMSLTPSPISTNNWIMSHNLWRACTQYISAPDYTILGKEFDCKYSNKIYLIRMDFIQYGFNLFDEWIPHLNGLKRKFIPIFNSLRAWPIHLTDGIRIIAHHRYQALDTFHTSIIINHQVGRPTNSLRFWTCNFWYMQSNCRTATELIKLRVFAIPSVIETKKKTSTF